MRYGDTFRMGASALEDAALPWFHIGVLASFALAVSAGDVLVFGYQMSAIGWVAPLAISLLTLGGRGLQSGFHIGIWVPWIVVIVLSAMLSAAENAWHRSLIMLTPLVVGLAAGTYHLSLGQLLAIARALKLIAVVLASSVAIKASADLLIFDREAYAFPAEAIAAVLLFTFFSAMALSGYTSMVPFAMLMAAVPILSVNRGPIVAMIYVVCFGFLPIRLRYRVAVGLAGALFGLAAFHLEAVQAKMFFSGSGTLADLYPSNPDLRTSGRQIIWDYLFRRALEAPWFGHGANASEDEVFRLTEYVSHPHNDWLRIFYEYGVIGILGFLIGYLGLCLALTSRMRRTNGVDRAIVASLLTALVSFGILMITDNIILYTAYYTSPLMLLIGTMLGRVGASGRRAS